PAVRSIEFAGLLGGSVSFLFPSVEDPTSCVGDGCAPLPLVCVDLFCQPTGFDNLPVRTYWRQEHVD
nr:hypothetical protein [Gammaproteobacteria bacterium]